MILGRTRVGNTCGKFTELRQVKKTYTDETRVCDISFKKQTEGKNKKALK